MMEIESFLSAVRTWAGERADISAVLLVGSHARGTARADSDVDLVILTSDPAIYIDRPAFAERFGAIARSKREDWGRVTSIRVFFANGLEVEFGFTKPDWLSRPLDEGTARVLRNGFQIIFTREAGLAEVRACQGLDRRKTILR